MKIITRFSLFTLLTLLIFSCSNPKKDAEKVCDCIQTAINKIQVNPNDSSYSLQKCIAMGSEIELTYKEKPEELMEYHIQLDSCNKKNKLVD